MPPQGLGHRRLKARIALQAAHGMAYLHSQGMVGASNLSILIFFKRATG